MRRFISFFAGHPTVANLILLLIVTFGIVSFFSIHRSLFPEFRASEVQILVVYRGAVPTEIENSICDPLYDSLEDLVDMEELSCVSSYGLATARAKIIAGKDMSRFVSDIQSRVDSITSFPQLEDRPIVMEFEEGREGIDVVLAVILSGDMTAIELKRYSFEIRKKLLGLGSVSKVDIVGFSDLQFSIEPSLEQLRRYNLSLPRLEGLIRRQNIEFPAGSIEGAEQEIALHYDTRGRRIEALKSLVIASDDKGGEVTLGQVANIVERFQNDKSEIHVDGARAAFLLVKSGSDNDILDARSEVIDFVGKEKSLAPKGVEIDYSFDIASIVRDRLHLISKNAIQGGILVFLSIWLFFNIRFSFWVLAGLPISFLGALYIMNIFDYNIDMLTMVALLISIGIIMDDSIIISENIAFNYNKDKGVEPLKAVETGVIEVIPGVLLAFATSVLVFLPLAFLEGEVGKILRVLPVVLIITVSVSLIEAFLILPHHILHSLESGKSSRESRIRVSFEKRFSILKDRYFKGGLQRALNNYHLTLGTAFMIILLSISLPISGILPMKLFPSLEGNYLEAFLRMPEGTSFERVKKTLQDISGAAQSLNDIYAETHNDDEELVRHIIVFHELNGGNIILDLLPTQYREMNISEIISAWYEEIGDLPVDIDFWVSESIGGPGGQDVEIWLSGDDLSRLKRAALEISSHLEGYSGVLEIWDDLLPGKPELRLSLKGNAGSLGVDSDSLARQLRIAYSGTRIDELQLGEDSYELRLRLDSEDVNSLSDLDYYMVENSSGELVPLSAVASISYGQGAAEIKNVDGVRRVTVSGTIDNNVANVNMVFAHMEKEFLPDFKSRYSDISISIGGEIMEQEKTLNSLITAALLGLLSLFVLLGMQFANYVSPFIVLMTVFSAFTGAVLGHIAIGIDLTMPSFIGVVALSGVAVNDSILVVLFINEKRRLGLSSREAVLEGTMKRFRAVFLTSLTTALGLTPMLFETDWQAQVLVPLVCSMAFGIVATSLFSLYCTPCIYLMCSNISFLDRRLRMSYERKSFTKSFTKIR